MSQSLEGKVAIITGAGSGIGRATALLFAREGARLVLGDKTDAVFDTARSVVEAGGVATALQGDAGVEADVASLVATALSSHGRLDVAFANAGVSGGMAGIFDLTPEHFAEVGSPSRVRRPRASRHPRVSSPACKRCAARSRARSSW